MRMSSFSLLLLCWVRWVGASSPNCSYSSSSSSLHCSVSSLGQLASTVQRQSQGKRQTTHGACVCLHDVVQVPSAAWQCPAVRQCEALMSSVAPCCLGWTPSRGWTSTSAATSTSTGQHSRYCRPCPTSGSVLGRLTQENICQDLKGFALPQSSCKPRFCHEQGQTG